ncbi:MAG: putative lipid II flippase FtsW [Proteobacteria bacterium]|nr:putative lipid II flippase FtsW [Pseudomonadota bacterium]
MNRFGTPHLLIAATLLVGGGLVMVYSASAVSAELEQGASYAYLLRQLAAAAVGLVLLLGLARMPVVWIERLAYLAWAASVVSLAATFGPWGNEVNGARRWLVAGPVSFQPLELAKLGVIVGVARWLSAHSERIGDFRVGVVMPALLAGLPAALLLAQPDFGGAMLLLVHTGVLLFAAGARLGHLGCTAVAAAPVAVYLAVGSPYRVQRLVAFFNPWSDPLDTGYQLVQSELAFGAGGWTGAGLGAGLQKLFYLPEAHTDFIFSVIGEEAGLVGVGFVLACFAVIAVSSLGIASRAPTGFGTLLALGAGLVLWLQAALNMGVATGLLPTKGTTLPLVSFGGSSLVASLVAIGLILAVARPRKRRRAGWR